MNKPTHNIVIRGPDNEEGRASFWKQVGVAWENERGQLKMKLDVGTVLDWRLSDEFALYIMPANGVMDPSGTKR